MLIFRIGTLDVSRAVYLASPDFNRVLTRGGAGGWRGSGGKGAAGGRGQPEARPLYVV